MAEPFDPLRSISNTAARLSGTTSEDDENVLSMLPIETEEQLERFIWRAWGIRIPNVQICEHHSTPWRAFCDAYFAYHTVVIWHASRGFGGKSFMLSLLAITEAVTLKVSVNILGGSGEQSQRVLEHMNDLWQSKNAPVSLLESDPLKKETRLNTDCKIKALMASQKSVRGPHVPRLRLDEIDEMEVTLLNAALGQTMSKNGVPTQTCMSSTRQYMGGTMDMQLERAATEQGWSVHEWCYRETLEPHGWLPQADIESKKLEVTAAMFKIEYDLQEPSPDTRAIQPDAVREMFSKVLGDEYGSIHEPLEFEPPIIGATYSTGADWARKKDFTEIVTYRTDCQPIRLVAYLRTQRLDWPVMIGYFNERVKRYGGEAFFDQTGLGDVVAGYIEVEATGVIMVGKTRSDMVSNYIAAIERREIISPYIKSLEGEHRFASVEDCYMSSGHLPDGMAAGCLMYKAINSSSVSEDDLRRIGANQIQMDGISESFKAALRMSGIDPDKYIRDQEKLTERMNQEMVRLQASMEVQMRGQS